MGYTTFNSPSSSSSSYLPSPPNHLLAHQPSPHTRTAYTPSLRNSLGCVSSLEFWRRRKMGKRNETGERRSGYHALLLSCWFQFSPGQPIFYLIWEKLNIFLQQYHRICYLWFFLGVKRKIQVWRENKDVFKFFLLKLTSLKIFYFVNQLIITCVINWKYSFIDEIDNNKTLRVPKKWGSYWADPAILTPGHPKVACSSDSPVLEVFCSRVSM